MGCDIHSVAIDQQGAPVDVAASWSDGCEPFGWRSYGVFGFLADVRNYSEVAPISEPRGYPEDFKGDLDGAEHSESWLSVAELESFDYDIALRDTRSGEHTTLRDFLGVGFFADIAELKRIGADRVVFGFDS